MDLAGFISLCNDDTLPAALPLPLQALWHDRKGDWNSAHEAVQDGTDRESAALHAYLHRKEGDLWNARYWYSTAGRKPFSGSLDEEWESLAKELLKSL